MIASDTAALALSIAQGLIRFGGRLDRLLAEKVATRSGLVLAQPAIDFSPGPNVVLPKLQAYLAATTPVAPGVLGGAQRAALAQLLPPGYVYKPADLGALRKFYALAFPAEAVAAAVSPDANFLAYLRDAMPGARESLPADASDKDKQKQAALQAALLVAAFSVDPGADNRQLGYPVRVGLLVVDALAEFGTENTQLLVRDQKLQKVVQAVLEHFAKPDLESYDTWSPLLRHVLSATLNGALDTRAEWQGENPWLGAALGALAEARDAAGTQGDDYLLGLVHGRGYQTFVSAALSRAAGVLNAGDAPAFQRIAADVLESAAPLVNASTSFDGFFADNWTALVHAGLVSLEQHGPALLRGQSPLLRDVLTATIEKLAATPSANLLTSDTLFAVTNAALGAVAVHPELWKIPDQPWLGELISSVVGSVSDQGVQKTFTKAALATILKNATATVAAHPEWLVKNPGLLQTVVGGVLKPLSGLPSLTAATIADAAVTGALKAIAARPDLLGTKYPDVIASFAGLLAAQVKTGGLSELQARDLADAAAGAVLLHPALFADATSDLAAVITRAVLRASAADQTKLVAGATTVTLAQQLFATFARNGAAAATTGATGALEDKLVQVLSAGLSGAQAQLGKNLTLPALPAALAGLVANWLAGDGTLPKANDPAFQTLFAQLAAAAEAGAAA